MEQTNVSYVQNSEFSQFSSKNTVHVVTAVPYITGRTLNILKNGD